LPSGAQSRGPNLRWFRNRRLCRRLSSCLIHYYLTPLKRMLQINWRSGYAMGSEKTPLAAQVSLAKAKTRRARQWMTDGKRDCSAQAQESYAVALCLHESPWRLAAHVLQQVLPARSLDNPFRLFPLHGCLFMYAAEPPSLDALSHGRWKN